MAGVKRAGIAFGEGTTVVYRDEYSYIGDDGSQKFCSANCDSVLEKSGQILGQYNNQMKQIALFRGAVGREMTETAGMVNGVFTFSLQYTTSSGVETAIRTLGHESAHSLGIDIELDGAATHPNAEAAGVRALETYRNANREK